MQELSIISIFVSFSIVCFIYFGWIIKPLTDPVEFIFIPILFLGKCSRSLHSKWIQRRTGYQSTRQQTFWHDSFVSLLIGCCILTSCRSSGYISRHCTKDRNDIDNCVNFGGCKSGPEHLPEATVHSILFSTRWSLDSEDQGVQISKNNCKSSKMIVPRVMKSRFRLPMSKIWTFPTDALVFTSKSKTPEKQTDQSLVPNKVSLRYFTKNGQEFIEVKMDENTKTFQIDCIGVQVKETFSKISIEKKGDCKKRPRNFKLFDNERMKQAISLAIKHNYIIKSNRDYLKIILSSVYNEFGEEDNVRLPAEDVEVCELVPIFINIIGMTMLVILMITSTIVILIDSFFSKQFFRLLDSLSDSNSFENHKERFPYRSCV